MATQRRRDRVGRSGLGESGSSGDNNGSSEGERMGASQRWNTRHVRTARRGQLPHPIGQVRVQGVDGRERQLCPPVVPPGLERVSGGRAGRRITNLYSTARVAGDQRAVGGEIPPQRDLAEESRFPQFLLWQSAGSTASRGRAGRACQSKRCNRTEHRRGKRCTAL